MLAAVLSSTLVLMQPAAQPAAKPEPAAKPDAAAKPEAAPAKAGAAKHPLITEVLYAVPKDSDPDQDGKRSATGDEFVELVNPHKEPINLKGYRIADAKKGVPPDKPGNPAGRPEPDNRFSFTFPDLTLQPGEVAVVFNGYQSGPPAPCGTADAAGAKHPKFHDAYVFSARVTSQYVAFSNNADCIGLYAPDGSPVECIYWGQKQQPEAAPEQAKLPETRGSAQRTGSKGPFASHADLPGSFPFSPGQFSLTPAAPPSSSSPASTPSPRK